MGKYTMYRVSAVAVGLSGLCHLVIVVLGDFSGQVMPLLPFGVMYLTFAVGLMRSRRWVAYVAFLFLLFGFGSAITGYYGQAPVPAWGYLLIMFFNVIAVIGLFGVLWCGRNNSTHVRR